MWFYINCLVCVLLGFRQCAKMYGIFSSNGRIPSKNAKLSSELGSTMSSKTRLVISR